MPKYFNLVGALVQAYIVEGGGKILPSEAVTAVANFFCIDKEYVTVMWAEYMLECSEERKINS